MQLSNNPSVSKDSVSKDSTAYQVILAIVEKAKADFIQANGVSLDLTNPEHFLKLAEVFNFEEHFRALSKEDPVLPYSKYSLALGFVREFLIKSISLQFVTTRDRRDFVEAIFGKLFDGKKESDYAERIARIEDLGWIYQQGFLDGCLSELVVRAGKINDAIKEVDDNNAYSLAYNDAFHNILLGFCPPFFYSMLEGQYLTSMVEIKDLFNLKHSQGPQ